MKKFILAIVIVLFLGNLAQAQEIEVRVRGYAYPVIVQPIYLFPLGHRYTTPVPPQLQPEPLPKPQFKTPLRDGLWYSKIHAQQMLQHNRYLRYKRLEGLLGVPPQKTKND